MNTKIFINNVKNFLLDLSECTTQTVNHKNEQKRAFYNTILM